MFHFECGINDVSCALNIDVLNRLTVDAEIPDAGDVVDIGDVFYEFQILSSRKSQIHGYYVAGQQLDRGSGGPNRLYASCGIVDLVASRQQADSRFGLTL